MKSAYFRELKRYTQSDIAEAFDLTADKTVDIIKKLKYYGVAKSVKVTTMEKNLTELTNEKIVISDVDLNSTDFYYVFDFVGIITVGNYIFKCYPKYLSNDSIPLNVLKQVLRVIRKYNSKEQVINLYNGESEQCAFNLLAVILFLLNDYNENGIYSNQQDIIEANGDGEILWDRTIDETFAIISNNRPFYIELQTQNTVDDEMNYFRRLHQCVITECSNKLKSAELTALFDVSEINLYDGDLTEFGDTDYILYRLQRELNVQFVTRKQVILKTIYAYIAHRKAFEVGMGISMYGTNSFNLIWERVCAEVFDNKLKVKLRKLQLPKPLGETYTKKANKLLLEIIDKPIWRFFSKDDSKEDNEVTDTLTPDIISIYQKEDKLCFGTFDAKYYNIVLTEKYVAGNPGVGDVTKQYLYQLAYNQFINEQGFDSVQNAFLMPTEENKAVLNGEVEMSILQGLSNPPLQNILVVKLPATEMYQWYLNNTKVDIHKEYDFL